MRTLALLLCFLPAGPLLADEDELPQSGPWIVRVEPLGGTRGSTALVEVMGERFGKLDSVWFDTPDLRWSETLEASATLVRGRIAIAPGAALGPHLLHLRTSHGRTNTRLFNVVQFPMIPEMEPNDPPGRPQEIELRSQVISGLLKAGRDIDVFRFTAKAGEQWTFDLRSIEYGSHLECEMALTDDAGQLVAFNDDRDDYLETPLIQYRFQRDGVYRLKLDQYRGPQGVTCAKNCGYLLQISQLPLLLSADPMGWQPGKVTRIRVQGERLDQIQQIWLAPVRAGETYRLTFPFTVPLQIGPDRALRVEGRIVHSNDSEAEFEFAPDAAAPEGLWRLWAATPHGVADGLSLEASQAATVDEGKVAAVSGAQPSVINGRLAKSGEEDRYALDAEAGKPIHAWTLATQLGLPRIDTVLALFDGQGKLLAESDDLMTGQGTVIGNPDSSLYFTPAAAGRLFLSVRDRTGRGGADFAYRLHLASEQPGFRLLTEPEEFRAVTGETAELSVLLIPDPGFHEVVDTWVDGLPNGVQSTRGQFRADQHFGPSGDGDNVNIPETVLRIQVPRELAAGEYPIRVFGRPVSGGPRVEAFTTLWIGAPRKRNDVRRPLPAVTMTVIAAPSHAPKTEP